MRVKQKKIYYCEFCNKHGLRKDCIENHEKYCTANPKRECRMCKDEYLDIQFKIEEEKDEIGYLSKKIIIGYECPACILSFVRRNKIDIIKTNDGKEWNYEQAVKKWWQVINEEENEDMPF